MKRRLNDVLAKVFLLEGNIILYTNELDICFFH